MSRKALYKFKSLLLLLVYRVDHTPPSEAPHQPLYSASIQGGPHTSAGVGQLCATQEPQVARPGPVGDCVSKAESGVEVVRVQRLLSVHGVVPRCIVGAAHPNLTNEKHTPRLLQGLLRDRPLSQMTWAI